MFQAIVFVIGYALAMHLAVALYGARDLGAAGSHHRPRIVRTLAAALALYALGAVAAGPHRDVYAVAALLFVLLHGLHYAGLRVYARWLRARNLPG